MTALEAHLADYLRLRRSLGYKLATAHRLLPRLVAYLDANGVETVTVNAALTWAQQPDAGAFTCVWAERMTVARGFARYLAGVDPRTEVPPIGLMIYRRHRRIPHLYSNDEVCALMAEARRSIPSPLRAATVETVIGLLAVTGMRVSEAIHLERPDVDWAEGTLTVRETKYMKSRRIPLQSSTIAALAHYARRRDQLALRVTSTSFFVSSTGNRVDYAHFWRTFRTMCDAAGIGAAGGPTPRIHDLRHSFAVRTLTDWQRSGVDIDARLPWLSTYLGHREPRYTYWYLTATPELLAVAAQRLEAAREARP